ncbi:Predicted lipid-binding transport protein, Tim44 family [Methylobacterium sp. 174MFSha1.1]|uniref:Tim44 domain-containing protein n=1 Tax=Methylobacterium sp. 174MFSha1.1 TaxID=1502749 RepID=UPI0008EB8EAE|nr:TIM44-like domain-containing protein [Methylobacterium sp. 174MFSha1.1]SFV07740.1 Predicted lipid-binding transport protein, Tim44 family [Methylobacterium sp. 174MFSha1.1]
MMTTFSRGRRTAVAFGLAALMAVAATAGEARPGSGSSMGSRGSKTYSAPPSTATAPGAPAPMQRSMTQPGSPMGAPAAPQRRFGGGFFAGLLGAGLLGALIGGGFFGGLGGIASFLGLLLQVGLLVGVVFLVLRFFRRRQAEPAMAGAYNRSGPAAGPGGPLGGNGLGGLGAGLGGGAAAAQARPAQRDEVGIGPQDFEAFERTLGQVQLAYGAEDAATLRRLTTPEMFGYFGEEIRANAARGVVNKIADVKLQQGDLAESWREGPVDYATVAMRYTLRDAVIDRASGRVVETNPPEATEVWTFMRERGGQWVVSAIQQTR